MRLLALVLFIALSFTACGPGKRGARPASSQPQPVGTAEAPPQTSPTRIDNELDVALDIAPWRLQAISSGKSTDIVQVTLVARNGPEMKILGDAADLAGLVASWRGEEDVSEFYRIVEAYALAESPEDTPGTRFSSSASVRRVKRLRSIEGGFELEREGETTFGSQKIRMKPLKVTLRPHFYLASTER